ncbi:MAG: paraslipin, partial [Candidatus Hydrogenedentota bacterium]
MIDLIIWGILFAIFMFKLVRSIRIVPTRKAYIVERLGKYSRTLKAGIHVLFPFLDKVAYILDLREETIEVPPQMCFTKDNVKVEVDGVIYISVTEPEKAAYGITNYRHGAIQLAQTTMRSVIGILDLDTTFEERELINAKILEVLSEVGHTWGIEVHRYEIKNIVPPVSVKDAMERQMTAERDKRAMIAKSEGEKMSLINQSEGQKAELINMSEGYRQRLINEAEGKAAEILAISKATAAAISQVADAAKTSSGAKAIALNIAESYLAKLSGLAKEDTKIILPADLTRPQELLSDLGVEMGS